MSTVAALCVASNSVYKTLPDVQAFDKRRDVRSFTGGMPVVAHPPCGPWSAYVKHQSKAIDQRELGPLCVGWLRREGGVLEHPAHSGLFTACGLPMPESVRDRCTKAHEYLFLLAKSERYHFDAEAMQERAQAQNAHDATGGFIAGQVPGAPPQSGTRKSGNKERKPASARGVPVDTDGKSAGAVAGSVPWGGSTRNKRSVWTVGTEPFSEAHFATFPPALIEPCIKAGCPEGGTVLDPFFGAGTTGLVADRLHRSCIGIELNPAYIDIAERRIRGDAPLFAHVE